MLLNVIMGKDELTRNIDKNTDNIIFAFYLGPLFMNDGRTEPTLVGVVSFGSSCGQIESPAVFSKVDHVLNWIHKTMSKYN